MTEFALAHEPGPFGDRLDVADHDGRPVGWVDLGSGRRVVFQASQGAAFDAAVDLWFDAVGDNATSQWRGSTPAKPGPANTRCGATSNFSAGISPGRP